jgi:hypothetical protein
LQVHKHFKPELLNRLSVIVVFEPLSRDRLKEIVAIQMKNVTARVATKGISLCVSDAALDVILSESYNPVCMSYFQMTKLPIEYMLLSPHLIFCIADVRCKTNKEVGAGECGDNDLGDVDKRRSWCGLDDLRQCYR